MLQRVFTCALLAGLIAGLLTTVLQLTFVTPIILAGEVYETSAENAGGPGHIHDHGTLSTVDPHDDARWASKDGMERAGFTALATVVSCIGFALMLIAVAMLSPGGMSPIKGIAFGLAGYVATGLAPSFGLPPELPGSAADALFDRQVWWIATAICSAAGMYLLAYGRLPLKVLGLVALAAPHIIGAPDAGHFVSTAPAELAARFASRALVVQALMWVILGTACGWIWEMLEIHRLPRRPAQARRQVSSHS